MSEADKMFEKLGYSKTFGQGDIYYYKDIEIQDEFICFIIEYKSFTKRNCYKSPTWITMNEMKAINQKCKELGWLDE